MKLFSLYEMGVLVNYVYVSLYDSGSLSVMILLSLYDNRNSVS